MAISNKRAPTALALAVAITAFLGPAAADAEDAPDLERGEALYELCTQCHLAEGQGNRLFLAPAIGGMPTWYVESQLTKFRDGIRGSHPDDVGGLRMRPMSRALPLGASDVKAVAAYVETLPKLVPTPTLEGGNPEAGKALYALCGACHGQNGEGMQGTQSPPLAHLQDWYLVESIWKYKEGVRGSDPRDSTGVLMGPNSPASLTLTDEQKVKDVVAYVMTLAD